jgi:hypothetical protein
MRITRERAISKTLPLVELVAARERTAPPEPRNARRERPTRRRRSDELRFGVFDPRDTRYRPAMIIAYMLILGGLVQLGAGWHISATTLAAVGGLWIVAGSVNLTLARRRPPVTLRRDELNDPTARARVYQGLQGSQVRGYVALACGATALAVGALGVGFDATSSGWRALPVVAGATVGGFALLGLFVYWASSVERSVKTPATVVIRAFKDKTVNVSNSSLFVEFDLDVYPEGMAPYRTAIDSAVPIIAVSHLAVGNRFPAQVAGPDEPKNVIVDWRSPIEAAPAGQHVDVASLGGSPGAQAATSAPDGAARLRELDSLRAQGLVTEDEYQAQRARILGAI